MKTINTYYQDNQQLKDFIKQHSILDNEKTILQMFTGICERTYINNLISDILKILPNIQIIGSTTDGEILGGEVSKNETVLSFSMFEKTKVVVKSIKQLKSSFQTAKKLIRKFDNLEDIKLSIVFADGLNSNGEGVLKAFNKLIPKTTVSGGLAGDNAEFVNTYVFTKDGIKDDSIVTAVFYSPNLIVNTTSSFGWKKIGKKFTVTKATENRVYLIDNQTPTQLYKKYLGDEIGEQLPATGIEFPLMVEKNGEFVARAVVGKEDDGSLIFAGNIKRGDSVWFGYGNVEEILTNNDYYDDLASSSIETIFVYSCMARKRLMGSAISGEILPLSSIAPVSGFFTYGEFFGATKNNLSSTNQLCNQTMTILTLSEKASQVIDMSKIDKISSGKNTQTIKALSHLISETTKELHELNDALENKIEKEVLKNREKDKQLLSQSRLAQMGEMISMIAHQWRQPLSAISATSTGINIKAQLKKLDNDTLLEGTKKISEYAQHLSQTIDDFRDFYKSNKEARETTLGDIIQGVLNIVKVSVENRNISLIVENNDTEKLCSYPNEIKQVVLNLIKNAEDIVLEKKVDNPYIKIVTYKDKNKHILEVSDNGGGIDEDIIDNIFDPYFSTKTQKDGTGLGLYMSKTIIHEHCKGELNVHNSDDGAIFRIKLDDKI